MIAPVEGVIHVESRRRGIRTGQSATFVVVPVRNWEDTMAARRKKKTTRRSASKTADLIISKARTKGAVRKCNVGGEFYGALDAKVRDMIKHAEGRAIGNKRKTLKAVDL